MFDTKKMQEKYGFSEPELYDQKSKRYLPEKSIVYLICDYCKKGFDISAGSLKSRLNRRKNGYSDTVCQRLKCRTEQRSRIAKQMGLSNVGLVSTKKGKTFEEFYGEERSEEIKGKIRKRRLEQPDPRLGKKHSKETKEVISIKKKDFYSRAEKNYKSIVSGELVDFKTYHSEVMRKLHKNMSRDDRVRFITSVIEGIAKGKPSKKNSFVGEIKHWYTGKMVRFESSYEYIYFKGLNVKKVFWKRNTTEVKIQYDGLDGKVHLYTPDALIYEDRHFKKLKVIVEVKPYDFLFNPNDKEGRNYEIAKLKRDALISFCNDNNLQAIFITEKELDVKIAIKVMREKFKRPVWEIKGRINESKRLAGNNN